MKLAVWIPYIDENPGGLGVYMQEICTRLFRQFPDHVLFTLSTSVVPDAWRVNAVHKFAVPARLKGKSKQAFRYFALNVLLRTALRQQECDVVFIPFHEGMFLSPLPQALVVHDLTMLHHPSSYFSPLLTAYMRYALPIVVENAEAVICVSDNTAFDVASHCGIPVDDLQVVTEGYNAAIYHPRSKADREALLGPLNLPRKFILYSGTMAPHKNTTFLADILTRARSEGMDIDLVLTGRLDSGSLGPLRERLQEFGTWENTHCVGYVSQEQLSALMQEAFAFVFPSLYEGFGLAPLEAMASGAAVISSNRASLPQVIQNGGALLEPNDLDTWIGTLFQLEDPNVDKELRMSALESAARYDWNDASQEIGDILRSIAN